MNRSLVHFAKRTIPFGIRVSLRKLNWKRKYLQQTLFGGAKGPNVYCPIDDKEWKAFVKIPGDRITIGNDWLSPSNGARMRQRLVWLYLENETKIFTDEVSLLHVAPEVSYMPILKTLKNLDYFPGDKMVEGYGDQKGVNNIDLTDLTIEENKYDYILCNHVLEHIPDDSKAMSEMFRVLKPGGRAIITVPIDETLKATKEDENIVTPEDREEHFGQWDHVRWYGTDVKDRLEAVGFQVDLNRYIESFSKEDQVKFGLPQDLIVVANKPA
jgi:SAM-dependent methyltransferase